MTSSPSVLYSPPSEDKGPKQQRRTLLVTAAIVLLIVVSLANYNGISMFPSKNQREHEQHQQPSKTNNKVLAETKTDEIYHEAFIIVDPAKIFDFYSSSSSSALFQNLDSGSCYVDSHRLDLWNPVNCPDDSAWIRHWLKARSDILKHSIKNPKDAQEMIQNFPKFLDRVRSHQQPQQEIPTTSTFENNDNENNNNNNKTENQEKLTSVVVNDTSSRNSLDDDASLKYHPYARLNEWLMIDVGANKGFTLSRWTESLMGASRTPFFNSFRLLQEALTESSTIYNHSVGTTTTTKNNKSLKFGNKNSNPMVEEELSNKLPIESNPVKARLGEICGACCDCADEAIDFRSQEEFDDLSPFGSFQKGKSFFGNEKNNNNNDQSLPAKFLGLEPVRDNFDFLKRFFVTGDEVIMTGKSNNSKTKISSPVQMWQKIGSTTHRVLDDAKEKYFSTSHADNLNNFTKYFDVRFAAASVPSSHRKRGKFRVGPFGIETMNFRTRVKRKKGAAADRKELPVAMVDLLALDQLILAKDSPYRDRYIDVLTTDTEGFDLDVARGAESLLFRSNRIKMYIFEMHQKADYTKVFQRLVDANYECFYPIQPKQRGRTLTLPQLVKITGIDSSSSSSSSSASKKQSSGGKKCWVNAFGKLSGWMNTICANKVSAPELVEILGSLTRMTRNINFHCGTPESREAAMTRAQEWISAGKRH